MKNKTVASTSELIAVKQLLDEAIADQYAKRFNGIGYDPKLTDLYKSSEITVTSINRANTRKRHK